MRSIPVGGSVERAAREQTVMCNQVAGLSRCLTRVQDAMSSQLITVIKEQGFSEAVAA